MRVLLTGATGFLGARLLPLLAGHDVLCPSREPSRVPLQRGVRSLAADLTRQEDWEDAVAEFRPDCCVHLAWEGLPDYSTDRCRRNLDASARLLKVLARGDIQKVIVAGSCWEYGRATGAADESRAFVDVNEFAATKHGILAMLDELARSTGFTYHWARVFFAYGPGQRPTSLIPALHAGYLTGKRPAVSNPSAIHDFIHVDDVAGALLALVQSRAPSGVFNVGTGAPRTVADIANLVADFHGAVRPFSAVPAGDGFWADTGKMTTSTGWSAKIPIDRGIAQTLTALAGAA